MARNGNAGRLEATEATKRVESIHRSGTDCGVRGETQVATRAVARAAGRALNRGDCGPRVLVSRGMAVPILFSRASSALVGITLTPSSTSARSSVILRFTK